MCGVFGALLGYSSQVDTYVVIGFISVVVCCYIPGLSRRRHLPPLLVHLPVPGYDIENQIILVNKLALSSQDSTLLPANCRLERRFNNYMNRKRPLLFGNPPNS